MSLNEKNDYNNLLQMKWPVIAPIIINLIKTTRTKDVKDFKKSHGDLIQAGTHDELLAFLLLPSHMNGKSKHDLDLVTDSFILHVKPHENFDVVRKNHESKL
ncbi:hypothetical protein TKK_0011371 [Trichogramma kaykai]